MNLTKLFEMQKVLMKHIEKEHPLRPFEDRFKKKIVALFVEVGECANEVRSFKFWSHKPSSPENVVLEEYVDGLHFILDLGISENLNYHQYHYPEGIDDIDESFLEVFESIADFRIYRNDEAYDDLLYSYIYLGATLGFTWEVIEQAYFSKNAVNHQRQTEGY